MTTDPTISGEKANRNPAFGPGWKPPFLHRTSHSATIADLNAYAVIQAPAARWWEGLSPDERKAVRRYKWMHGHGLNSRLHDADTHGQPLRRRDRRAVAAIDAALAAAPVHGGQVTVYRGERHHASLAKVTDPAAALTEANRLWPVESLIRQPAFTSWSLSPTIAVRFTHNPDKGAPVLFRTVTTGGVHLGVASRVPVEWDLLMPRHSVWRVNAVDVGPPPELAPKLHGREFYKWAVIVDISQVDSSDKLAFGPGP